MELLEAVGDLLPEKDLKTKKAVVEVLGPAFAVFCCHPAWIVNFNIGFFSMNRGGSWKMNCGQSFLLLGLSTFIFRT